MKRRSLSAVDLTPDGVRGALAMRRGGARHELTERVWLRAVPDELTARPRDGLAGGAIGGAAPGERLDEPLDEPMRERVLEGWALNISRGGVRVILEELVELGAEFEVTVGDEDPYLSTRGRIVWLQEEPDGVIAGVEFLGLSGLHRAPFEPGTVPPPR